MRWLDQKDNCGSKYHTAVKVLVSEEFVRSHTHTRLNWLDAKHWTLKYCLTGWRGRPAGRQWMKWIKGEEHAILNPRFSHIQSAQGRMSLGVISQNEYVTLRLCKVVSVLNYASKTPRRRMGQWRYSSTILGFSTRWWSVVCFTHWPPCHRVSEARGCWVGPQTRSGHCTELKDISLGQNWIAAIYLTADRYTNVIANRNKKGYNWVASLTCDGLCHPPMMKTIN